MNEFDVIIKSMGCAVGYESAIYLAGPLTSGLSFSPLGVDHTTLIRKNTNAMFVQAGKIREQTKCSVINPAALTVSGWKQEQYWGLWESVIRTFAKAVWLMPDWQYSCGTVREVIVARSADIPVYSITGIMLSESKILKSVRVATSRLKSLLNTAGYDSNYLNGQLSSLETLYHKLGSSFCFK